MYCTVSTGLNGPSRNARRLQHTHSWGGSLAADQVEPEVCTPSRLAGWLHSSDVNPPTAVLASVQKMMRPLFTEKLAANYKQISGANSLRTEECADWPRNNYLLGGRVLVTAPTISPTDRFQTKFGSQARYCVKSHSATCLRYLDAADRI